MIRIGAFTALITGANPLTAPTWTLAAVTVFLALGAIVTAIFAILAFRQQSGQIRDQQGINRKLVRVLELQAKDLIAADDQRRRAQASQVLLRSEVHERDMRLSQVNASLTGQQHNPRIVMTVENTSGQPIHDAELRWEMDGIPAGVPDRLATLAPGEKRDVQRPIPPGNADLFTASLYFRDAKGVRWKRGPDGEATELTQPA
jgi:hypothetical protein